MAKARNTPTERICPDCQGAGSLTVRHPSGDPQLETDADCPKCTGGWIRFAPVDPLILLAHMRPHRFYRTTQRYQNMLARVAVPVKLPKYRPSLVRDAQRDARVALQNHAFVMGHFDRLLRDAA